MLFFLFFFKYKPAYELRIIDWSSDVCSSDLVAGFAELLDDVADLARAEELRFLDVDDAAGFCERHHEVGLSREKGRELQNVDDFGDWRGLPGLVHVGDQRYAELGLHGFETPPAFLQHGRAPLGERGGAYGG